MNCVFAMMQWWKNRLQFRRSVLGARGANLKALLSIGLTLLSATGTTRAGVYAGEAPDATELLADFRASVKFSHVSDRRWIDLCGIEASTTENGHRDSAL